jgi:hypothetical protein
MSYPKSSDVVAGQPTAAAQYNNLRADALWLGACAEDAVTLGQLLNGYEDHLRLEEISGNRIRVPASAAQPVCLMIDGLPAMSVNPVDLPTGSAPSGDSMLYYVFAVRTPGSTAFTLEINTSSGVSTGKRIIGRFDWTGRIQNLQTLRQQSDLSWLYQQVAPIQQARLTLESGVAVPVQDRSGSTLYLTPYQGNRISLYAAATEWQQYKFNECSLSFSGVAAGKNADVFLHYNGSELVLEKVLWSDDDSRAEELSQQDGIWLRASNLTWRYLGTVRTSAEGVLMDSAAQRFVWNAACRVPRTLLKTVASGTYTYTGSVRLWRGDAASRVQLVCGLSGELISVTVSTTASTDGVIKCGVGINGTSFTASVRSQVTQITPLICSYYGLLPVGYVAVNALEFCSPGTGTFMPEGILGVGSINGLLFS